MKAKIWFTAPTGIFIGIGMDVQTLPAQGNRASRPFSFNFGAQNHPGSSSALGRSWFFTPGRLSPGRGLGWGFPFGTGTRPLGGSFLGIDGNLSAAPYPYFYGQYPGYGMPMDSQNDNSNSFVEQWLNRNPFEEPKSSNLAGSPLLSEGMTEEEVIKLVGGPIQKNSLGEIEVWKSLRKGKFPETGHCVPESLLSLFENYGDNFGGRFI